MRAVLRHPAVPTIAVFLAFVFGFTLLNLVTPSTEVSVYERRALAQRPDLTIESILDGTFGTDFGSYMQDQAGLRDELRFLKSFVERGVFRKAENNGVYVVDDRVYDKFYGIRDSLTREAGRKMNEIIAALGGQDVYLAMIPSKAEALAGRRFLLSDQRLISGYLADTVDAAYVDLMGLPDAGVEGVYYGADPHWTAEGARRAYEVLARAMGIEPVSGYEFEVFSTEYVGSEYGKAAAWRVPLDTIHLPRNQALDGMTVCRDETADRRVCHDSIYVEPGPDTVDLYDVYLGGLAPIMVITNEAAPVGTHLVIFKDSFGHALAPFLAQHFQTVTLVDLRYVQRSYVFDSVDFEGATTLFLYSTSVINTDPRALN